MATLNEQHVKFLDNPYVAAVTTMRDDGSPQTTVVWVETAGTDEVQFNTAIGRAKEQHLRENPWVSLTMIDPQNSYKWVSVSGKGELTTDDADAQIDRLAKKYMDKDEYPFRTPDEERVTVKIRPEYVDSSGFDGDS